MAAFYNCSDLTAAFFTMPFFFILHQNPACYMEYILNKA